MVTTAIRTWAQTWVPMSPLLEHQPGNLDVKKTWPKAAGFLIFVDPNEYPNIGFPKMIQTNIRIYSFQQFYTNEYPNIFLSKKWFELKSEYISENYITVFRYSMLSLSWWLDQVTPMYAQAHTVQCASRQYIWRKNGQALKPKYTVHSVHPGSKSRLFEREKERPLFQTVWKSKETGQTVCF